MSDFTGLEIAVIGMSGRFPGAATVAAFWENLRNGRESVTFFTPEELREAGVDKALINDPDYIAANAVVADKQYFDPAFFGYTPAEARLMDPQLRIFHEESWKALEDAGCIPGDPAQKMGIFAGGVSNLNWEVYAGMFNKEGLVDDFTAVQLSNINHLATRISYVFNLSGPAVYMDTACSTSLVAIHHACKALLVGDCTIALAGGVSINNFSDRGYMYREGMINSIDGHCRAFDKDATGTISGEGAGVVVLKSLKHALRDGDNIHAIIRGSAVNNDGNRKVGYTAPSIEGQAAVILAAQKWARVQPETITYIEAHGTGTKLGDPVEIAGLTRAFVTTQKQYCAIGSVKTNIGHLDAAAGVAGLIKTILALKHREIPPSLHYREANPNIDFSTSPFYVNHTLKKWESSGHPLRAGVSSFGIGGTNAHVILEEAPGREPALPGKKQQLLLLSGKTPSAVYRNALALQEYLTAATYELADIAFTLQTGRTAFSCREAVVCSDKLDAIAQLNAISGKAASVSRTEKKPQVVFMFPGQGSQYVKMCEGLLQTEPVFAAEVQNCCRYSNENFGKDFYTCIYHPEALPAGALSIDDTAITQPTLFILEYALAKLLQSKGIVPAYMIGHSIGEYTAACISGLLSLEDALRLVIKRGELMQQMKKGSMLSISTGEQEVLQLLKMHPDVSLAAVNSSELCAVGGTDEAIARCRESAEKKGFTCRIVRTSHAFHSYMMDEMLEEFASAFENMRWGKIQIPFISNLTGNIATAEDLSTPEYWVRHLRETVRFSAGIDLLLQHPDLVCIETGPGKVLCTLMELHARFGEGHTVVSLVKQAKDETDDHRQFQLVLGKIWKAGLSVNWPALYSNEKRYKVSLPAYRFEQQVFPVKADVVKMLKEENQLLHSETTLSIEEGLHAGSWQRSMVVPCNDTTEKSDNAAVIITDGIEEFSVSVAKFLRKSYKTIIHVQTGEPFFIKGVGRGVKACAGYENVWDLISKAAFTIDAIYCFSPLTEAVPALSYSNFEKEKYRGFVEVCALARTLAAQRITNPLKLFLIGNGTTSVMQEDTINPWRSTIIAPAKIIPLEQPNINCRVVDVPYPFPSRKSKEWYATAIANEQYYTANMPVVAYRYEQRWIPSLQRISVPGQLQASLHPQLNGVYMITGGAGGMGFTIARKLLIEFDATVILVHRSPVPEKNKWKEWLLQHEKDKRIREKIESDATYEAIINRLYTYQADISLPSSVNDLFTAVNKQFRHINGLIWAAGEVDHGGIIQNRTDADLLNFTASKIQGLLLFAEHINFETLGFLALFSSAGNHFYKSKFGQVSYNAANEFLESCAAYYRKEKNIHAFTINWCDWLDVGMTIKTRSRQEANADISSLNKGIHNGIYPQEGAKAFLYCLQQQIPVITVYKGNLEEAVFALDKMHAQQFTVTDKNDQALPEESRTSLTVQEQLLHCFRRFFENDEIAENDDFFERGGDSLKAMTLIARINQQMGTALSVRDIYRCPTIKELTGLLVQQEPETTFASIPKAAPASSYKTSFAQRRMYYLQSFDPESIAYNEFQALQVMGPLNRGKLEHAFKLLLNRHEAFRTSFHFNGEDVEQVIHETTTLHFKVEHAAAGDDPETVIQSFIRPFDLGHAPLLRVGLVQLSADVHLLITDTHHIAADGVTKDILLKDFMAFYMGEELPAVKVQYKDYAVWQQSGKEQSRIAAQRTFWLKEFEEPPALLDLPLDFPRPAIRSEEGGLVTFSVDKEMIQALRQIASENNVSFFHIIYATYTLFLARITGQEDLVIGVPAAGRVHADLEGTAGMFVNTLPVRHQHTGTMRFTEMLQDVKQKMLTALENQEYPYEQLIEELQITRDTSRNPLFDVMLSYQTVSEQLLKNDQLVFAPYESDFRVSKFDLTLNVWESADALDLSFEYSPHLFRENTIHSFTGFFREVLRQVIVNKNVQLSSITIISTEEKRKFIEGFAANLHPFNRQETFCSLFTTQAAHTPDNIAVRHNERELSYKVLHEQIASFTGYLSRITLSEGTHVAVLLPRSPELLISMVSIFQCGAVYIPIDVDYPAERIQAILADSGATVVLTSKDQEERLKLLQINLPALKHITCVDELKGLPPIKPVQLRGEADPSASMLAYMIYTSGTTGKPKGAMVHHLGMLNHLYAKINDLRIVPGDVVAQTASPCFDISIWQFLAALLTGATTLIIDKEVLLEPRQLVQQLDQKAVTIFESVPSLITTFLDGLDNDHRGYLTRLRWMIPTGEALTVSLAKKWYSYFPAIPLLNAYGPTEASDDITHYIVSNPVTSELAIPIGKPIQNTHIYILDKYSNLCPQGIKGEICVAGICVGKGYYNDPVKTAKVFVPNPFLQDIEQNGDDYAVIYRTGDWGYYDKITGDIEYLGRIDEQVKIRGFRIELGEIEYQLNSYADIQESVVIAREEGGLKYLTGYYVSPVNIEPATLRSHLQSVLPDYMVPSYFVQ
ncbi:MAG: amino acid adenylation domain-containing protein, partial [Bacteroidetes bacterium]|nr:amino acid adenylation domain-containing protein [Bacteroidota bacterium]